MPGGVNYKLLWFDFEDIFDLAGFALLDNNGSLCEVMGGVTAGDLDNS